MRLKIIQENIDNIVKFYLKFAENEILDEDDESPLSELLISSKVMAAELLQEEDPIKTLIEAFLQILIIASILGIDLEKSVSKELYKLNMLVKAAGA